MSDPVSAHVLREMIRGDLELAFDHLLNDNVELFLHELDNAREKGLQLQTVQAPSTAATLQPLLIDAGANSQPQPHNATTGNPAPEPGRETGYP